MIDLLSSAFIIIGSVMILISSIGLIRLPDLYMRMSATTKASTLGVGFILIGTALFFWEVGIVSRLIIIIVFLFLTAPIAAHMIGRAAYIDGVKLWEKTKLDQLKDKYDRDTHELKSDSK